MGYRVFGLESTIEFSDVGKKESCNKMTPKAHLCCPRTTQESWSIKTPCTTI